MINFDVGRSVSESSPSHYNGEGNTTGGAGYHSDSHRIAVAGSRHQFHTEDDIEDDVEDEDDEEDEEEDEIGDDDDLEEVNDHPSSSPSFRRPGGLGGGGLGGRGLGGGGLGGGGLKGLDPTNLLLLSDSGDRDIDESLRLFGSISTPSSPSIPMSVSTGTSMVKSPGQNGGPGGGQEGVVAGGARGGGGQGLVGVPHSNLTVLDPFNSDPFNSDPYKIGVPSSSSSSSSDINQALLDIPLTVTGGGSSLYPTASTTRTSTQ